MRGDDLADLSPREQAELVAGRALNLIPSVDALAEAAQKAADEGRQMVVKYGIDPTSPDVHIGHAVPIIIASRLQRMGHHVVFIIGDVTAKIGDPSGRSDERPALTDGSDGLVRPHPDGHNRPHPRAIFPPGLLTHSDVDPSMDRVAVAMGVLA